jgi:V8-like Glu-specific endopeptidase
MTRDKPTQPRSTDELYDEPKRPDIGLGAFTKLVGKRGPDPLYAGHAFRNYVGDPIAGELVAARQAETLPEVVVGKTNFLPAVFLRTGYRRSLAVCRIMIAKGIDYKGEDHAQGWKGTGFIVGPKLLLTNHHVLNSMEVARESICQFNFLIGDEGKAEAYVEFRLLPNELFVTSPYHGGLDYTFVAIEPGAAAKFGTVPLERAAYVIHPGTFANIIQHPDGRPQDIVLHDNEVLRDTGTLLHYVSDTDYGSSGSPVFDNKWKLIGLHHARKANDNHLRVGNGSPPPYLNEGIKISTIATDIEQRPARGHRWTGGKHPKTYRRHQLDFRIFRHARTCTKELRTFRARDRRRSLQRYGSRRRRGLLEHRMVLEPVRREGRRSSHRHGRLQSRHLGTERIISRGSKQISGNVTERVQARIRSGTLRAGGRNREAVDKRLMEHPNA